MCLAEVLARIRHAGEDVFSRGACKDQTCREDVFSGGGCKDESRRVFL